MKRAAHWLTLVVIPVYRTCSSPDLPSLFPPPPFIVMASASTSPSPTTSDLADLAKVRSNAHCSGRLTVSQDFALTLQSL